MKKDIIWSDFFVRNHRYADIINGIGCKGLEVVREEDLQDEDTRNGGKSRDVVRKVAFGTGFALIGIENQENMDYKMPLRTLVYDAVHYEKQAKKISRKVREEDRRNLRAGEYLYGFRKESRLHPVITFILYSGEEPWDGAGSLHEILNMEHIPEIMRKYVSDYRINVVDIRRLKDTSVFKTDVKQVFDFLRCCDDREKLEALLKNDEAFRELEEDTVKLLEEYADSASLKELLEAKKYQKGENRNMCKGLQDWEKESIEKGRSIGLTEGKAVGLAEGKAEIIIRFVRDGVYSKEKIAELCGMSLEEIEEISAGNKESETV